MTEYNKNSGSFSSTFLINHSLFINILPLLCLQIFSKEHHMKKASIAAVAAVALCTSAFAETTTNFKVSGYLRAGLSSTMESTPALSTRTWLGGIYFNGDSSKTRGRINLSFDGSNDTASYGAFLRLQYTGKDDSASASWGYGDVSYAFAYAGLFNNMFTVAAGKLKDNWIGSSGFEGYSVLDGKSGALVSFVPVKGLTIAGAGIIDYSRNDSGTDEMKGDTFLGGVKYSADGLAADISYAGYGLITANITLTGFDNLVLSAETKIDTDHGMDVLGDQRAVIDEYVKYTGISGWTFGLLSFQTIDSRKIAGDSDFQFTITPAVAYQINKVVGLSAEATYKQGIYDNAPNGYMTIVPAVKLSADKSASANLWASISTDNDREKSSIGLGVIKEF
jgi:hypothetical protein